MVGGRTLFSVRAFFALESEDRIMRILSTLLAFVSQSRVLWGGFCGVFLGASLVLGQPPEKGETASKEEATEQSVEREKNAPVASPQKPLASEEIKERKEVKEEKKEEKASEKDSEKVLEKTPEQEEKKAKSTNTKEGASVPPALQPASPAKSSTDSIGKADKADKVKPDVSKAKTELPQVEEKPEKKSLSTGPKVSAPTRRGESLAPPPVPVRRAGRAFEPAKPTYREPRSLSSSVNLGSGVHPWRKNITATVFWIGETPTQNNPVPNNKSSWDTAWQENFGGFDNPDPTQRTQDFCPRGFIPRLNPFYVALPYNDCVSSRQHKPEAARVIPWFHQDFVRSGASVCKGKWVQIFYRGRYCFAQWEDCGPFNTEDWSYVFGSSPPKNTSNKNAGIDISPAVRDYLGFKGGDSVHWRFVDVRRIPRGPWSKYGENNPFVRRQPTVEELRRQERTSILKKMR